MILFFFTLAGCLHFSLFDQSEDHQLRMVPGRSFLCGLLAPYLRTWSEHSPLGHWITLGHLCPRFKQALTCKVPHLPLRNKSGTCVLTTFGALYRASNSSPRVTSL
ncbi:unnamed protein product [Citrullus colocynthis]|uniref:Secreted protein n=1 Tax=Citrullus colocynthis TaxID=252529 RepID=A0ABP0XU11_9ROSI